MIKMNYRILLICIMLYKSSVLLSQEEKIATGYYEMLLPKNYVKEEIEREIIEKAKIQAIERAFGEVITGTKSSSVTSTEINQVEEINYSFSINSFSFITGRWLQDINPPEIVYFKKNDTEWVSVLVKGLVKKIDISSIASNPSNACDYFALALSSYDIGNIYKAIEYMNKYVVAENSYYFEPHQFLCELMTEEGRQDELVKIYTERFEADSCMFNQFLVLYAKNDREGICELSDNNPSFVLAKLVAIKQYVEKILNFELIDERGCDKYLRSETYYEFVNSSYYKNASHFLSLNAEKNFITPFEKQVLKGWAIQREYNMNSYIKSGKADGKTKDDILNNCIEIFLKSTGCNKEETTILFNKLYKE